jgi:hypothetical protein
MVYVPQVGGAHYDGEIQHWDVIEATDVAYLEATASKYIDRWRHKGTPAVDLQKAISYLEKMNGRGVKRSADRQLLERWFHCRRQHHQPSDRDCLALILHPHYGTSGHIETAIRILRGMLIEVNQ